MSIRQIAARIAGTANFTHGLSGYRNYGCRCVICRTGQATAVRAYRQLRASERRATEAMGGTFVVDGIMHGRDSYSNHSCRCAECVTSWHIYARTRYAVTRADRQQRLETMMEDLTDDEY